MVSRGKYPSVKVVAFELKQWHIIYDSFDLQMAASSSLTGRTWDLSMVGRIVWRCEVSRNTGSGMCVREREREITYMPLSNAIVSERFIGCNFSR